MSLFESYIALFKKNIVLLLKLYKLLFMMFYRIIEKEKDKNTVLQASSNPHFRIFWDSAPLTPSPDLLSNLLAMLGLILTECYLRKAHEILRCLEVFQNLAFGALYLQVRVATNHKNCGIKSKPQKKKNSLWLISVICRSAFESFLKTCFQGQNDVFWLAAETVSDAK